MGPGVLRGWESCSLLSWCWRLSHKPAAPKAWNLFLYSLYFHSWLYALSTAKNIWLAQHSTGLVIINQYMLIDPAGPRVPAQKDEFFSNIIQEPQTRPGKSTYEVLTYAPWPNSHSKKNPSPLHPTEGRQEVPEATGNQHHPMRRTGHSKNFKLYRVGWGRRKGGDCLVVQGFLLEWLKVLRTVT